MLASICLVENGMLVQVDSIVDVSGGNGEANRLPEFPVARGMGDEAQRAL